MNFYIVTANTSFEWKSNSVEPPCPPSTKQTVLSWTGSTEHWSQLTDDSEQLRSSHNPSIRVFESPSTRVSNYLTIQVSEYLSGLWATEEFSRTRSAGFPLAVSYCPIIRVSEYSSVQLSHNLSIRVFEHPSISQSEHPSISQSEHPSISQSEHPSIRADGERLTSYPEHGAPGSHSSLSLRKPNHPHGIRILPAQ